MYRPYDRLRETLHGYPAPTFQELLQLCLEFGLVAEYQASLRGVHMRCVNQTYEVSVDEAEMLVQGLLLGYFFGRSGDDLSLADWAR